MYDIKVVTPEFGHVIRNAIVQIAYRGFSISITEYETRVFNGPERTATDCFFQMEGCNIDTIHRAMACIDRLVDDPVPFHKGSIVRFIGEEEQWLIMSVSARGLYEIAGHENFGNAGLGSAWHDHVTMELVSIATADTWRMMQEVEVLDEDEDSIELDEEENDDVYIDDDAGDEFIRDMSDEPIR